MKKFERLMAAGLVVVMSVSMAAIEVSASDEPTVIQVALDANVSPFSYSDDNGDPAGYDYEVLCAIDELLEDYEFEYQVVDYDAAAIGLEAGQYDIEAGDKYKTSARMEKFLITDSSYYAPVSVAVAADSGIETVEDLEGKELVPVPEADGLRQVYLDYVEAHPDTTLVQETGSSLVSIADGLTYVASGRYDAMIDSPDMFNEVLEADEKLADKIKILDEPMSVVGGHYILNKEREDLCEKMNEALATMKEDGTLGKISTDMFGYDVIAEYADLAND